MLQSRANIRRFGEKARSFRSDSARTTHYPPDLSNLTVSVPESPLKTPEPFDFVRATLPVNRKHTQLCVYQTPLIRVRHSLRNLPYHSQSIINRLTVRHSGIL